MTTVQLSSTFNTVHKNTSHINEQSVYTQGRPRTCDHTKRLYISHSLSHTHTLSLTLFLTLSFFLFRFVAAKHGLLCTKKIFRLESQVGLKKGRNMPRESTISPGVETVREDALA